MHGLEEGHRRKIGWEKRVTWVDERRPQNTGPAVPDELRRPGLEDGDTGVELLAVVAVTSGKGDMSVDRRERSEESPTHRSRTAIVPMEAAVVEAV